MTLLRPQYLSKTKQPKKKHPYRLKANLIQCDIVESKEFGVSNTIYESKYYELNYVRNIR